MNHPPRSSFRLAVLAVLLVLVACPTLRADTAPAERAAAAKKATPSKFIRVRRDAKDQPVALETATVRYVSAAGEGGLVVDLIGVVHVGEQDYYEKLNQQFEQYDALLYELVAPPGTRIPKGGKRGGDNPIAFLQRMMKTVLQLDSQLEHVDYTKKNFVHADLSPEQMAEAIRKRGDDGMTLFSKIFADLVRQQNLQQLQKENARAEVADLDLFTLLLDPDASVKLKRLLATQFEALEGPGGGLGETLTTLLVTDRNEAAMKVFEKETAKGRKKIGIFYGAAHMPDFEKRLRAEYGLKRAGEQWQTAWELKAKKKAGLEGILNLFGE